MSKPKLSKQQKRRIDKLQGQFLDSSLHENGLVLISFGTSAIVESQTKQAIFCTIRAHMGTLVAGDEVVWQRVNNEQGVIVSCFPRKTVLMRSNRSLVEKPVAANLSQIVIVAAVKPKLSFLLLDSYLVMAECLKISPLIVLNKIDLDCKKLREELEVIYKPLAYRMVFTSQEEISPLLLELSHQVSVFVGQSGVGKSSLIRKILPDRETIQTAALSHRTELGCHTTSNSRFYHLAHHGALIDSPGIRELNLTQLAISDVVYGFPEFRSLVSQCSFRNCRHDDNAGCALAQYVRDNPHALSRYTSLQQILKGR